MKWLVVIALTACGQKEAPAPTDACQREAAAIAAEVRAYANEPPGFSISPIVLPLRTDLRVRKFPLAPVVHVQPETVAYNGELISPGALTERLSQTRARLVADKQDPELLYLAIDKAVPWRKVVDVVNEAIAAQMAPTFLFSVPVTRPPRTELDAKADALEKAGRVSEYRALIKAELANCPQIDAAFGPPSDDENIGHVVARGIGDALVACNCHVNLPNVRTWLWRMFGTSEPVRPLYEEKEMSRTRPIVLPATMSWEEASTRIKIDSALPRLLVE